MSLERPSPSATTRAARRCVATTGQESHLFDNPPPVSELEWGLIDLELRICERNRKGTSSEFVILGDTYPHDDLLQDCGATWCEEEKLWKFSRYDHLLIFAHIVIKGDKRTSRFLLGDSGASDFSHEENVNKVIGKIRQKFDEHGESTLTDLELIVLFLSFVTPNQNIRDVAKYLLINFRNLGSLFCAEKENLSHLEHIEDSVVSSIKTVHALMQRILREKVREGARIASWKALIEYLGVSLKFRDVEEFRVLYLDGKNRLIKEKTKCEGTVNHVAIYPREIVKDCIILSASSVIMVHNHPSGDAMPSDEDLELTNKVKIALESIEVKLHDHVIIGRNTNASFRQLKFL